MNVTEKQTPFVTVQIERGTRRYGHGGWCADIMVMIGDMDKLGVLRDCNDGTEKIFGFMAVIDDCHMGASAVGICLRHHDGRMHNFEVADAVRMGLCRTHGKKLEANKIAILMRSSIAQER